jgi:hypothetical protein
VENLKKEKAATNPQAYGQEVQQNIEEKLENHKVKENELNSEVQQE